MPFKIGKNKKEKIETDFDTVIAQMKKNKVPLFMIISQLAAALSDLIDEVVQSEDIHLVSAVESHVEKILLSKVKEARESLERIKKK